MNRAYALLNIKGLDDEQRVIRGIATTPTPDRVGDSVDQYGVTVADDIPLFLYHDSTQTVGRVKFGKPTKEGIPFEARIPKVNEPGRLKDRLDEAWQMVRHGLINAVSIGFRPLENAIEQLKAGGLRFLKTEVLELSLVPVPAQPEAVIQGWKSMSQDAHESLIKQVKNIDQKHLAAKGRTSADDDPRSGVSGHKQQAAKSGFFYSKRQIGKENEIMKTIQELREMRQTKAARLHELVELFKTEDHEASDEETTEFDGLTAEVKTLDQDIRIAGFHAMQGATAKGVEGSSSNAAAASRGGLSFVRKEDPDDKFKGQAYTRFLIAKAAAFCALKDGNYVTPGQIAEQRWGKSHPKLVQMIKAAVAGGGTGSGEWGAELAQSDTRFTGDFIEYLYGQTVFDRLPLRSIPARVHVKGQDGAATGYWVGESKAIPVTKPDFSDVELTPLKVGAIAVCSKELVMSSSPSAEQLIRDSIVEASSQRVDTTFLSANAASAGVSPAGLLNGLSGIAPSGADAAAVRADLLTMYQPFLTAKNASGLVQIMTPSMAKALALLVNALGQPEFVGLNADGGTLLGDPVYTGDNVTPGNWILLKPSDIWKIGDGGVQVSMSDTATIEQNDAPQGASDTPTAASATLMSMWQTESVAFKVVRSINYAKRRSGAVVFLDNAEYGGVVS